MTPARGAATPRMKYDVLTLNAGSSSFKFSSFTLGDDGKPALRLAGQVEGIGAHARASLRSDAGQTISENAWQGADCPQNHEQALAWIVAELDRLEPGWRPHAVGHRVVHGGTKYRAPVAVDSRVLIDLERLIPLAPLHEPANLSGIRAATKAYPGIPQIACFDTSFHQGHPWVADTFALPRAWYERGIRRYGFHGLSYEYIARSLPEFAPEIAHGKVVVAHLGNGASLCALADGKSIDSTMSFTALDGLPMGTRSGQIDPGALLYLMDEFGLSVSELTELLYYHAGLLGLSGVSSDMRELMASDRPSAKQAIDYFVYRIVCSVSSLAGALGGIDALIFTAGIGQHSPAIRERVCQGLTWLGLELDPAANQNGGPRISRQGCRVPAWVIPTDEERMVAMHVAGLLRQTTT